MVNKRPEQPLGETYFYDSVGTTLRKRRQELNLTLGQVSRQTKIRVSYLEALEHNDWQHIPHTVHVLGFVRQYAQLVGLDSQVAATKYVLERGPILQPAGQKQKRRIKPPIVGSRIALRAGMGLLLLAVVVYLGIQLSSLAAPPSLEVTYPPPELQTSNQTVEVHGKSTTSASVSVNGTPVPVDDAGSFTSSVNLVEGLNVVTIEARNRAGKVTRIERSILVNP